MSIYGYDFNRDGKEDRRDDLLIAFYEEEGKVRKAEKERIRRGESYNREPNYSDYKPHFAHPEPETRDLKKDWEEVKKDYRLIGELILLYVIAGFFIFIGKDSAMSNFIGVLILIHPVIFRFILEWRKDENEHERKADGEE